MGEDSPMKDTQDIPSQPDMNHTPKADLDYFECYLDQEVHPAWKTLSLTAVVDLDKLKTLIAEVKALRAAVYCKDRVTKQWEEAWRGMRGELQKANDRIKDLEGRNKDLEGSLEACNSYWTLMYKDSVKELQMVRKAIKDLNDIHGL